MDILSYPVQSADLPVTDIRTPFCFLLPGRVDMYSPREIAGAHYTVQETWRCKSWGVVMQSGFIDRWVGIYFHLVGICLASGDLSTVDFAV